MPPLSSLIPQKWPDIQIDAPLGSGACGTVYACTKKSAVTGIESREAVKVVRVEFSAAAHRQAEEEGIPFDEYYARIKAKNRVRSNFLSTSKARTSSTSTNSTLWKNPTTARFTCSSAWICCRRSRPSGWTI